MAATDEAELTADLLPTPPHRRNPQLPLPDRPHPAPEDRLTTLPATHEAELTADLVRTPPHRPHPRPALRDRPDRLPPEDRLTTMPATHEAELTADLLRTPPAEFDAARKPLVTLLRPVDRARGPHFATGPTAWPGRAA